MKRSFVRFAIILIAALMLGLIYNNFHPRGIKTNLLFHSGLFTQKELTGTVHIISADSAFLLLAQPSVRFMDLRATEDYKLDHIPGTVHVAFDELLNGNFKEIPIGLEDKLIIYDQEGKMEQLHLAVITLQQAGYTDISILFGGYLNWLEKSFTIANGQIEGD